MVNIVAGFTFTDSGEITDHTNVNSHSLITSATVSAITVPEFSSDAKLVLNSASAPATLQGGEGDSSLWWNSVDEEFRKNDGTGVWDDLVLGPQMNNDTGNTLAQGRVVQVSSDRDISPTHSLGHAEVLGVLLATATDSSVANVGRFGLHLVSVEGPVDRGDHLIASDVTGFAKSGTFLDGTQTFTAGVSFAIALTEVSAGATALVTALMWS